MEEHIVQHEEEQRPFHEWHIQSLDLVNGELPHIIEVLILETVATNKEEQRHVEHRYELPPHMWQSSVANHHQHDGHCLRNRYFLISHVSIEPTRFSFKIIR